ncbi:hypothetical protein [Sedimentitalea sp.]|uniref:hypothetical protein n=1 Tax=Sedimentitalea sp. TaxID=2048915 RepID=UPI00329A0A39
MFGQFYGHVKEDTRFSKVLATDKLLYGIATVAAANTLGVCMDDAERLKEFDTHEAHRAARFFTLLAFEREAVWRALAEIVAKGLEADGVFTLRGDNLQAYLADTDVLSDMAGSPSRCIRTQASGPTCWSRLPED